MDTDQQKSVENLIDSLKEYIEKDSFVHHEVIAEQKEIIKKDLSDFPDNISEIIQAYKIQHLYKHQSEGIKYILGGKNIAVSTPTSSGKTAIYNIPIISTLLTNPLCRALYIFPLKALEQDQFLELKTLILRLNSSLTVAIYDGDTSTHERKKIRSHPPNILFTTPDMLHSGIIGHHENWVSFFSNLRYLVVDELHIYSGVFGSHVLNLFRRFNRICKLYGSTPTIITSSATMGNSEELAHKIFNRPFVAVTKSGAPSSTRHFIFLNSQESTNTIAANLLRKCVQKNYRTIVFTRARVVTELIYRWVTQTEPDLKDKISSYRSGYLPEERRQIESELSNGDIYGVVSTSALELGIDIGGLDVCILVGYPGSIINTWQRAGRVGRGNRESLIILIAAQDALDQYFMNNPNQFFDRSVEDAVVDPENRYILKQHLVCAARELPLSRDDCEYSNAILQDIIQELVSEGELLESAEGEIWFAARNRPHRSVNIRSIGSAFDIVTCNSKDKIGSVNGNQIYTECYEGAIYLHRGRQYLIKGRDDTNNRIYAEETERSYFTRANTEKDTEIIEELKSKPMDGFMARLGLLKVSSQVVGYTQIRTGDLKILNQHSVDSPKQHFETIGFWIELDNIFQEKIREKKYRFMGSIHAIEHIIKSLFPLIALSNRTDVGGICFPRHPQLNKGAIFIYDYYPGGIGLAEKGFIKLRELLEMALNSVSQCDCENGCPSCIHFPTCGAGNVPLDKNGAIYLLQILTGTKKLSAKSVSESETTQDPPLYAPWEKDTLEEKNKNEEELKPRIVVFDLETQRSAAEVGGWNNAHLMGMSVGVVWDSHANKTITYLENDIESLISHLQIADLVVGFNVIGFDYSVLRGYSQFDFKTINTLDILRCIHQRLNYRVSLDAVGKATLNVSKTADGLMALKWFREGKIDLIEKYCRKDVELTRNLFNFALKEGYLLFDRKNEGRMRIMMDWDIEKLILKP